MCCSAVYCYGLRDTNKKWGEQHAFMFMLTKCRGLHERAGSQHDIRRFIHMRWHAICRLCWKRCSSLCCPRLRPSGDANIVDVSSYEELKAAVGDGKWARGPWAGQCFA